MLRDFSDFLKIEKDFWGKAANLKVFSASLSLFLLISFNVRMEFFSGQHEYVLIKIISK